jgi:hypothetical protein
MFQQQFEVMAEHNYWTSCEKATYQIASFE